MTTIDGRWFGFSVVALLLAGGCSKGSPADEAKTDKAQAVVTVSTALVTEQPFVETVGAIGTVQPRTGHFAVLSAPASVRIANVLVAPGQRVKKNEALVEFELAGFQAAARSAEAALNTAQLARDRAKRLVEQGVSARKDLELADADLARSTADAAAARRLVDLAVLRSPIDGVVTRMSATLGASADPTQPLVEVADPDALDVSLSLQPSDAARIRSRTKVLLYDGQRASGDSIGTGEVVDIAGMVDSLARTVAVRVHITSSRRPLRIGETVFGQILAAARPHALTVPLAALVPDGEGFKVFVVDSADIVHAVPVEVGGKTDTFAEILKGVSGGDRVVTLGAFGVDDGAKIVASDKAGAPAKTDSAKHL